MACPQPCIAREDPNIVFFANPAVMKKELTP
jgi:hypothetical protein